MTISLPASKRFVNSFLRLTRVWNLLILTLAQYFTAVFLIGPETLNDFRLFLLSLSTVLIAAAGYIINDYYDVKIDFINKPDRVVIGKSITRRFALLFHIMLSATGILIGFLLSWWVAGVNVLSVFLLWFYSNNLKRLPFVGNFAVALLTGLSILVVDVLYPPHHSLIWVYAVFAFFMTLVREIVKDIEDLKGDNTFGCKTLPIVWGIRKTKLLIYLILLAFLVVVLFLNYYYSRLPFSFFAFFLFVPIALLVLWLLRADMKKDFARLSTFCKIILVLGVISMAFV
ncbi:MAG TPA: geranylgeranylglycerol-phosphate geranylgeranyltransferase [Cyclobacteriaceae bacterium]|nr:geranylgeranylglycerol-phosphate geranylgeranyltransferase [Cyclobacteriaceae bacterium]